MGIHKCDSILKCSPGYGYLVEINLNTNNIYSSDQHIDTEEDKYHQCKLDLSINTTCDRLHKIDKITLNNSVVDVRFDGGIMLYKTHFSNSMATFEGNDFQIKFFTSKFWDRINTILKNLQTHYQFKLGRVVICFDGERPTFKLQTIEKRKHFDTQPYIDYISKKCSENQSPHDIKILHCGEAENDIFHNRLNYYTNSLKHRSSVFVTSDSDFFRIANNFDRKFPDEQLFWYRDDKKELYLIRSADEQTKFYKQIQYNSLLLVGNDYIPSIITPSIYKTLMLNLESICYKNTLINTVRKNAKHIKNTNFSFLKELKSLINSNNRPFNQPHLQFVIVELKEECESLNKTNLNLTHFVHHIYHLLRLSLQCNGVMIRNHRPTFSLDDLRAEVLVFFRRIFWLHIYDKTGDIGDIYQKRPSESISDFFRRKSQYITNDRLYIYVLYYICGASIENLQIFNQEPRRKIILPNGCCMEIKSGDPVSRGSECHNLSMFFKK